MTAKDDSREVLAYWADVGDNRLKSAMVALVDAILETDDANQVMRVATRLKFMASSVQSFGRRLEAKR